MSVRTLALLLEGLCMLSFILGFCYLLLKGGVI